MRKRGLTPFSPEHYAKMEPFFRELAHAREKGWGGRLYIALDELPGRETAATANWELCLQCVPFVLVADNMLEYAA